MKATLTFDLPEDKQEHNMAVNAGNYYCALWDIKEDLIRKYYKYGIPEELKNADVFLEKFREEFFQILEHYNVTFK